MMFEERALAFSCQGEWLYGIATIPEQAGRRGVLVVVGGPQYRVGSHRQFALLARGLASQAIPVMRFDYRGMGDSDGAQRTFDDVGHDMRAAIDTFLGAVPGMTEVVIWGLCDAASAALFYGATDHRVAGLVLLNPWVRTDAGFAKATLKHYYGERLLQPELWKKIARGQFDARAALSSFAGLLFKAFRGGADSSSATAAAPLPLPERMLAGLAAFEGRVLLILSGRDLTAQEFSDVATASAAWQRLLAAQRVARCFLAEADHTFSRRAWRDEVTQLTGEWITSW